VQQQDDFRKARDRGRRVSVIQKDQGSGLQASELVQEQQAAQHLSRVLPKSLLQAWPPTGAVSRLRGEQLLRVQEEMRPLSRVRRKQGGQHLRWDRGKHACCPSHPLLVRAQSRQRCALLRSRCSGTPCNSWLRESCLETALRQSREACLCWRWRRGESQGSRTFRWRRVLLENSSPKQLSATAPWHRHATIHMRQTWELTDRCLGGKGFIQSLTHAF
jgi:hypothetical protein